MIQARPGALESFREEVIVLYNDCSFVGCAREIDPKGCDFAVIDVLIFSQDYFGHVIFEAQLNILSVFILLGCERQVSYFARRYRD